MLKIKTIASMCKKSGTICLVDTGSKKTTQWVGDGKAFYPLTNIPYLEMANLTTLLELKEKQLEKISTQHVRERDLSSISFEDTDDEKPITAETLRLNIYDKTYIAFETSQGYIYMDSSYLKPLSNIYDELEFYVRRKTGTAEPYIICKTGLILQGIFMAENIITPDICKQMIKITGDAKQIFKE